MNPTYIVENTFRPTQFSSVGVAVGVTGAVVASKGLDPLTIIILALIVIGIAGAVIWYVNEENKKSKQQDLEPEL
ncbi:MAG TPA: hypothetical protein DCR04_01850 [Flavobacteriales bacterium]|nr:hypothetical protein [Flavobacteriales bacterium]